MRKNRVANLDKLKSAWYYLYFFFLKRNSSLATETIPLGKISKLVSQRQAELGALPKLYSRKRFWKATLIRILGYSLLIPSVIVVVGASVVGIIATLYAIVSGVEAIIAAIVDLSLRYDSWAPPVMLVVASMLAIFLSFRLLRSARHLFYPDADEVLDLDNRPPILFLRSFNDDDLQFVEQRQLFGFLMLKKETRKAISSLFSSRTLLGELKDAATDLSVGGVETHRSPFERVVFSELRKFGPVIALGRPGEKLPTLAVSRKYIDSHDAEWQSQILQWLDRSQLVVLVAGRTEGLRWEIDQLVTKGHLKKCIFLLPPSKKRVGLEELVFDFLSAVRLYDDNQRRRRWRELVDLVSDGETQKVLKRQSLSRVIGLYFSDDFEPVSILSTRHNDKAYIDGIRIAALSAIETKAFGSKSLTDSMSH